MTEYPDNSLIRYTKESYEGSFSNDILEQYKLYVGSAENVSSRRVASSSYLLTMNVALVAFYGFQYASLSPDLRILLVPILGIFISLLWIRIIKSHKNLNSIKFEIIHELERQLPAALFTYEWQKAGEGHGKPYCSVTNIEQRIPWAFSFLHLILLCVFVWKSFLIERIDLFFGQ